MYNATSIRERLAFDVSRLATAAGRLQGVDMALYELKTQLEQRARGQMAGVLPYGGCDLVAKLLLDSV